MFSIVRWLFFLLILLLGIAVAIPVAATFLVEQDTVKSKIESWFLENTGRTLKITGAVGFEPGLEIRLFAEDVELQNPKWAGRPLAVSAKRAELTIALQALMQRQVEVNSLMLTGADLWVEHDDDEGSNLRLFRLEQGGARNPRPVPSWFAIKRVDIEDSQIAVPSQSSERVTTVGLANVTLSANSLDQPVDIQANGAINGLPVTLTGTANTLSSVLSRDTTLMDLLLTTPGGDRVTAEGSVSDVLGWQGIEATLEFDLPSIPNLSPLFSSRPLDIRSFSGAANFRQPEKVSSMTLESVDGEFNYLDLQFSLRGGIANLARLEQLDFRMEAEQKLNLPKLLKLDNLSKPSEWIPALSAAFSVTGSARQSRLDIERFDLEFGKITASAKGGFESEQGDWSSPLQITMSVPDLVAAGNRFGLNLPTVGGLTATASLARGDGQFDLSDIKVTNSSEDIVINATGSMDQLGGDMQGQMLFEGSAEASFFEQPLFSLPLIPDLAEASGKIVVKAGHPVVTLDRVSANLPGGVVKGEGVIKGLESGSDINLQLNAIVNDWLALSEQIEKPLADIGEAMFSAELLGAIGETASLININGELIHPKNEGQVSGSLKDLGANMQGDLNFAVQIPQTEVGQIIPTLKFAEEHFSADQPISSSGKLMRNAEGVWSLQELNAETKLMGASLEVAGELSQLTPAEGRVSVSMVGEFDQDVLQSRVTLPRLVNIDLTFDVPIKEGYSRVEKLQGLINGSASEMRLSSRNVELGQGLTGVFDVRLLVEDVRSVLPGNTLFRENLPLIADLELEVSPERWQAQTRLRSGQNDFDGTVAFSPSDGRARLDITGTSQRLDVDTLLVPAPKEDRFFSEKSLVPEWMGKIDGSIRLQADRFSNHSYDLDSLDTVINYNAQQVSVQLSASRGEGVLNGNIEFSNDKDSQIKLSSNNLPVTAFRSLMRREIFQGGVIDIDVDLTGPGNDLAGILAGGRGTVGLDINDSSIRGSALDTVGGDIFSNLLRIFNPFIKVDKLVSVDCGAIRFDLADGRAVTRNGLAMKTDRVTLLGAGELSFEDEELELEIAPKPRKGFGISASSFAKMIRLGGTLSDPDIEASATGFFKSGAAIGAAIFSGGLSLIGQGLLDRIAANADVCALARGEIDTVPETFDDVQNR